MDAEQKIKKIIDDALENAAFSMSPGFEELSKKIRYAIERVMPVTKVPLNYDIKPDNDKTKVNLVPKDIPTAMLFHGRDVEEAAMARGMKIYPSEYGTWMDEDGSITFTPKVAAEYITIKFTLNKE